MAFLQLDRAAVALTKAHREVFYDWAYNPHSGCMSWSSRTNNGQYREDRSVGLVRHAGLV